MKKKTFKYLEYIQHIRFDCESIRKPCPKGCKEMLDKDSIEDHFIYHECPELRGRCQDCGQSVEFDQFRNH